MFQNHMTTMTSRRWLPVVVACSLLAANAPAQPAVTAPPPTAINGVYTGIFQRSDGNKKLKFLIKSTDDGSLTGLFTFELPAQIGSSVTYKLTGRYVAGAHDYGLQSSPFQFTTVEPMGNVALDTFDASKVKAVHVGITSSGSIVGSLTGLDPGSGVFNCGWLNATRDKTQPANLNDAMAAQLRAASVAGTPAGGAAPVARLTSIDGVYNGTYPGDQGPIKFKLTLTQQGGGILGGVFTVYLTNNSGTQGNYLQLAGALPEPAFPNGTPHLGHRPARQLSDGGAQWQLHSQCHREHRARFRHNDGQQVHQVRGRLGRGRIGAYRQGRRRPEGGGTADGAAPVRGRPRGARRGGKECPSGAIGVQGYRS